MKLLNLFSREKFPILPALKDTSFLATSNFYVTITQIENQQKQLTYKFDSNKHNFLVQMKTLKNHLIVSSTSVNNSKEWHRDFGSNKKQIRLNFGKGYRQTTPFKISCCFNNLITNYSGFGGAAFVHFKTIEKFKFHVLNKNWLLARKNIIQTLDLLEICDAPLLCRKLDETIGDFLSIQFSMKCRGCIKFDSIKEHAKILLGNQNTC